MLSESDTEIPAERVRKRQKCPSTYKRHRIRNAKVKGASHTNYVGKVVDKRRTGTPCKYAEMRDKQEYIHLNVSITLLFLLQ